MKDEMIKKVLKVNDRKPEEPQYKIIQLKEFKTKKLDIPQSTGFVGIDKYIIGGFRGGDLVIVSGQSGRGKTLYSLQLTKNLSENGTPTLFMSFEEPMNRIKWRLEQMGAKEDILVFAPKELKTGQVEWLKEKIIDALAHHFIDIVIIDNLDFLTAPKTSIDDKWTMQSRIIGMLKEVAIKYSITIILNAHVKKTDDSVPKMEDLYGSGDVYKLSDFVLFVHRLRDKSEIRGSIGAFNNQTDIIIEKNRLTGQLGIIHLEYLDGNLVEIGGLND